MRKCRCRVNLWIRAATQPRSISLPMAQGGWTVISSASLTFEVEEDNGFGRGRTFEWVYFG